MSNLITKIDGIVRKFLVSPALRISTFYILASCVYIFASDQLVNVLFDNSLVVKKISIYKGWGFVLLSGLFIYWILMRKKSEPSSSEEKLKLLAGFTFEGIVLHDNGVVIELNQAFSNITGYERDELIGRNAIELIIDSKFRHLSYSSIQQQKTNAYEILAHRKDGTAIWAEITSRTVLYQGRRVRISSFRDVTTRKKAENALAEREKQLSAIFDITPLLMMILDTDGRVLRVNSACLNLCDKSSDQIIGKLPGEVINCSSLDDGKQSCGYSEMCQHCVLNNSIMHTIRTHESIYKREAGIVMGAHNNVFERSTLTSTLYIDFEENPLILVSIDDITERVQMENVLREKNAILLKAQEIAKIGEFSYDVKSRTFKLSDTLARLVGLNRKIISVEEMYESMHPEDRDETKQYLQYAIENLNSYSNLYRRYKSDGQLQYLLTFAEIERDANGFAKRVFGVSSDITEQKKVEIELQMMNYELQTAEEELRASNEELLSTNDALRDNIRMLDEARKKAEESDRLKSAFLANMSHEIRTPMNAIMGFSDILDMEDMPFEKRKVFTKTIRQRTKDLLNIINDILDIARIESHTLRITERIGNIDEILDDIVNFFKIREEELTSKSIRFDVCNELVGLQNIIRTDFDRVKQVLINLIDNAYKYTPRGEISVGCKLAESFILFSVKDSGIGISQDNIEVIFERFRQVDESYLVREYGGAGLGLSICKGILDLLGGKIWVESEVGKGSTFFFTIPYKPGQIVKEKEIPIVSHRLDLAHKTILIVEDVEYNLAYLVELFRPTNAKLLTATNGTRALEQFYSNANIDLVLMDIRLPDTNGFDLTRKMLAERSSLKVIAQTAYASDEDKDKCFEVGCVEYITKPIAQSILYEAISKYV